MYLWKVTVISMFLAFKKISLKRQYYLRTQMQETVEILEDRFVIFFGTPWKDTFKTSDPPEGILVSRLQSRLSMFFMPLFIQAS